MDSTAFYQSRRAQTHAKADDIARQHFGALDILIIPKEQAPCAPGFALELARSIAKRVTDTAFADGVAAGMDMAILQQEQAAQRQPAVPGREGEAS